MRHGSFDEGDGFFSNQVDESKNLEPPQRLYWYDVVYYLRGIEPTVSGAHPFHYLRGIKHTT